MPKNQLPLPLMALVAMIVTLGISSWISPGTVVPLQQGTPTNVAIEMPPPTGDSWILVDLPEDATQLEYGAEVYRLVCKACHGDKGQGLTDEWRAQWAPEDQNCWQSKCHALNHPPDGFYMPHAPAVVGQPVRGFGTALNLHTFIAKYMPWHNPGSLTEKDSWSVTAYILKINEIDPGSELDAETAAKIDLSVIDPDLYPTLVLPTPETQALPVSEDTPVPAPTLAHASQKTLPSSTKWIGAGGLVLMMTLLLTVILVHRRRDSSPHE